MPFIQNRDVFLQAKSHNGRSGSSIEEHGFSDLSVGDVSTTFPRYSTLPMSSTPRHLTDDPLAVFNFYKCLHCPISIQVALQKYPSIHVLDLKHGVVLLFFSVTTKLVIAHPCMVLRRQCQVHQNARSLHLTPFTLVPVMCNMISNEGILTLWKGSLGSCVVWGLSNVTEIVLADLFGLPRYIVPEGSTAKYWKHIFLKTAAIFTMTPFYISSFTETVRSEAGLGGEGPNITEVLVRGIDRLRFPIFGSRDASRRFSVLHLSVPTVLYHTSHYIIKMKLYRQFFNMARKYVNKKPQSEKSKFHKYVPQLFAQTSSTILTDLILFPIETIMHRMYIQGEIYQQCNREFSKCTMSDKEGTMQEGVGVITTNYASTRTLIDNLDTGLSAISITAKYSGFVDCLRSLLQHEGFWALYSGAGALALEYLLHSLLHQAVRTCFDRGSEVSEYFTKDVDVQSFLCSVMLRKIISILLKVQQKLKAMFNDSLPIPFMGASSGNTSGPFTQSVSPVINPTKNCSSYTPPLRDSTRFPTFGESVSQYQPSFEAPIPQFPIQPSRPNAFGSPPRYALFLFLFSFFVFHVAVFQLHCTALFTFYCMFLCTSFVLFAYGYIIVL
ncbi:hypothetical protein DICVIV_02159 [Dictyocaulus viviparus]|uniref:Solute carrier family 25 member 46 n=1 Tax=Dictyocaulus viviparus TaxID=29172 RepID=A0A0D8Y411_DICVI|nr:hypothetical protein DICVIV_02159 [Dictyocaulus viviparus]